MANFFVSVCVQFPIPVPMRLVVSANSNQPNLFGLRLCILMVLAGCQDDVFTTKLPSLAKSLTVDFLF